MQWEERADAFNVVVADSTDRDIVLSRIPGLFGLSPKATFLAYRSMGLNELETLEIMDMEEEDLDFWRMSDAAFLEFENERLIELQATVGPELIRLGFMRNMALFVSHDAKLIRQAHSAGLETLGKRDYDYLVKARGNYGASDLLAIEKALGKVETDKKLVIELSWGEEKRTYDSDGQGEIIEGAYYNESDD